MKATAEIKLPHLNDDNLSTATAAELFELLQEPHPNEEGYNVSRSAMLKEWNSRDGEELTKEMGLPVDRNYPYENKHTGTVITLQQVMDGFTNTKFNSYKHEWWSVHEHWQPVTDFISKILLLESQLQEQLHKPIKPKSIKAHDDEGKYQSRFELRHIEHGIATIKTYIAELLPCENTEAPTIKAELQYKWETAFEHKEKRFHCKIDIAQGDGEVAYQVWFNFQPADKQGGSVGNSHSSGYLFADKLHALKQARMQLHESILATKVPFNNYNWMKAITEIVKHLDNKPVSNKRKQLTKKGAAALTKLESKPQTEPIPVYPGDYELNENVPIDSQPWLEGINYISVLAWNKLTDECAVKRHGVDESFYMLAEQVRTNWQWYIKEGIVDYTGPFLHASKFIPEIDSDGAIILKGYKSILKPERTKKTKAKERPAVPAEAAPIVKKVDGLQQVQMFDLPEESKQESKPDELFGYIAKDKGDRQRYKRKQTQLLDKLNALPSTERTALVRAVIAKFTPPPLVDETNYQ